MDGAQADVAELLSRLITASLASAGVPDHEILKQQPRLIKLSSGLLSSAIRNDLEGGGDDNALLHGLRKDLEASGADKLKVDKFSHLCGRLSPSGGQPGLPPRTRTGLLRLLRKLVHDARSEGGGAVAAGLAQSVRMGGLPQAYPAALAPPQHPQHYQQQQQQLPFPYVNGPNGQPQQQQQPQRPPQRQPSAVSVSSSMSGLPPYGGTVRPTYVVTPSEMGDDPGLLMSELSRVSLMGSTMDADFFERRTGSASAGGAAPNGAGGAGGLAANALLAAVGSTMAPSEPTLVRDALYAARGVSGRLLAWAPEGGDAGSGFRLPPACVPGVGAGKARLVAALTELGWLYRRVRLHADASGPGSASVRQALGAALRSELGDFFRLLALLEAQAGLPLPTPGDLASAQAGGGGQYLTLTRLLSWLGEPTLRMRQLAALGDAADGLEGGPLADAVHEYSLHGDPFVRTYMGRLLQQVCVPLYGMIRRWVLEGELDDPYEEFFVVPVRQSPDSAPTASTAAAAGAPPPPLDLWRGSYALDESRLPRFIEPHLARRVLRAGKAIHYLKLACDDERWVLRRADEWAGGRVPGMGPGAGGEGGGAGGAEELSGLECLVSCAVRSVDERLLSVLWRRHRLRAHWAAIRRFVLLGQGDWVTAFMDLANPELEKPASEVSEIKLTECLRQALTATNVLGGAGSAAAAGAAAAGPWTGATRSGAMGPAAAALEVWEAGGGGAGGRAGGVGVGGGLEEEGGDDGPAVALLAERLRVKKERGATAGERGWDVFSLHYNPAAGMPAGGGGGAGPAAAAAGGPLSALFTPSVLLSYGRLARLLWRLKRAERALSATWGAATAGLQRTVDKMGADAGGVQRVLATLLRLRAEMGHFATNLQLYIQFDVMEASWQDFYARAASCTDLDSLIAAHEAHLATLLRRALLLEEAPGAGGAAGGAAGASGPSAAAMRRALQDMLTNMVSLQAVGRDLEQVVESGARLAAANRAAANSRIAGGGWGIPAAAAPAKARRAAAAAGGGAAGAATGSGEPVIPPADLAGIARRLAELRSQHQRAVAEFTENLAEEAQDDMRFLLARLDFSAKGVQTPGGPGAPSGVPGQLRL